MKKIACVAITLLSIAGVASATCRAPHARAVVVHKPVVVKEAVVVKDVVAVAPVAVFVPVPVYSAVYAPPAGYAAPAAAPVAPAVAAPSEMRQVLDAVNGVHAKVDSIDARVRALEGRAGETKPAPAPATPAPPPKPDPFAPKPAGSAELKASPAGLAVLNAKCASCHEAKVAAEKGGSLTLLDGAALAKLTDRQARKLVSVSYGGRMPPKDSGHAPLTDDEVGGIVALVDSLK